MMNYTQWQASRSQLAVLSAQIEEVFATQTVRASISTWALAAAFPILGIGIVIVLLIVSRTRFPCAKTQRATGSAFSFFPRSGIITAKTIQHATATQRLFVCAPSSAARLAERREALLCKGPSSLPCRKSIEKGKSS